VGFAALAAVVTTALLTPQQKAALVVASGLPAPPGVGAALVQRGTRDRCCPPGPVVLADQEGADVRALAELPPRAAAADYATPAAARIAGRLTGRALARAGIDVDLAPVLDLADGPLGSRQFRSPALALAFARGLGRRACVKHFPGLGPLPASTDERLHVRGALRRRDLAPFRRAIRAGVLCVMVGHGTYGNVGPRRAALEPAAYALLRRLGFDGLAITDSFGVLGDDGPGYAPRAVRAGADLVLFTSGRQAREAIRRLLPLARGGGLDEHVVRVLRWRRLVGR
jgi:beta-N-acetylhexosaminidase